MKKGREVENIAIVGGGLLGLVLGHFLSEKGYRICIFEKEKKVGGLLGCDSYHDFHFEKYYHHIFPSDTKIITLIKTLNLGKFLYFKKLNSTIFQNGKFIKFDSVKNLLSYPFADLFQKFAFGVSLLAINLGLVSKNKNITVSEWYKKHFLKITYDKFVKPVLYSKFSSNTGKVPFSWYANKIKTRTKGRKKFGYLKGSFGMLVKELENRIKQNDGEIHTSCTIKKVQKSKKNKYSLHNKNFDKVIFTTPTPITLYIFSKSDVLLSQDLHYLADTKYLGHVSLIIFSKKKLIDTYWNTICDSDLPFKIIINHSKLAGKAGGKHFVYYFGSYFSHKDKSSQNQASDLKMKWENRICKLFEISKKDIAKTFVYRTKFAQHLVDKKYKKITPAIEEPVKNIFMSNFSMVFPQDRSLDLAVKMAEQITKFVS